MSRGDDPGKYGFEEEMVVSVEGDSILRGILELCDPTAPIQGHEGLMRLYNDTRTLTSLMKYPR